MAEVDAQARLLLKQKQADWRKTAKQLKAKDAPTKVAAIEKCKAENYEPILAGDCLGQVMQLLVAKKKNAPIVTAASEAILTFVKDGPQADVDLGRGAAARAVRARAQGDRAGHEEEAQGRRRRALHEPRGARRPDDRQDGDADAPPADDRRSSAPAATAEAAAAAAEAGTKVDEKAKAALADVGGERAHARRRSRARADAHRGRGQGLRRRARQGDGG